jgi:hypothetical protein
MKISYSKFNKSTRAKVAVIFTHLFWFSVISFCAVATKKKRVCFENKPLWLVFETMATIAQ